MSIFSEYLHPISNWIHLHPHWALGLTFIVSFSESLALIGSIIPGTVSMTAFGILAGAGIMRIDLTLLAATLGAIAGDSASYWLGFFFSERLHNMWPFKRYPKWLRYGKDYFVRHGSTSVFVGRFTGPLRSIIPIIAGMMGMNRWHFLMANVASAIGWACLYVIPGVLIGTASSDLSAQSASKLFAVILCFLAIIWVITLSLKWLFVNVAQWIHVYLNARWEKAIQSPRMGAYFRFFTPPHETSHYTTATIAIVLLTFILLMPTFLYASLHHAWVSTLDEAVYQFCLSIRTQDFDTFFIITRLMISYLSLLSFSLAILFYALYHRDWRLLKFWLSLLMTSCLIVMVMTYMVPSLLPVFHTTNLSILAFPARELMLATSLYGFLIFYMAAFYPQTISVILRNILLFALFFAGIALIYLGEDWIVNILIAYKIGFTNTLIHWMLYRRRSKPHYRSYLPINLSIILLLITTALSSLLFFTTISDHQQPMTQQFTIQYKTWWEQKRPILPLYSTNRFGKAIGLMNIQYVGSINALQQTLLFAGWEKQLDSFIYTLLLRVEHQKSNTDLPLMTQFYKNKKPSLTMTYGASSENKGLTLRLWRSNYHIQNRNQVIWLGNIQTPTLKQSSNVVNQLTAFLTHEYQTKTTIINPRKTRPASATSTILLLIKEGID